MIGRLRRDAWPLHRAPHWPLSVAVFLVALSFVTLVVIGRPWSFTSSAICLTGAAPLGACAALWTMRRLGAPVLTIRCENDTCRAEL